MTPILAILNDSLRQLRSRKLFWFVLGISALIVIAYGSIGFNERGLSLGYGLFTFDNDIIRSGTPMARYFLEAIFSAFIIPIWLAWGAIILALISTADVFPDFLSDGAIDLVISKPIRRMTIFLTKYLGSLLFVVLQVFIFCFGVFLIIGLRLNEWRWPIFYAVPIVTIIYSYLYAVMVLLNILTRSTLASLLLTAILWIGLFSLQSTESILNMFRIQIIASIEKDDAFIEDQLAIMKSNEKPMKLSEAEAMRDEIEDTRRDLERDHNTLEILSLWHQSFRYTMNVLPKPSETVNLVTRRLESDAPMSFSNILTSAFSNQPVTTTYETEPSTKPPDTALTTDDLSAGPPDESLDEWENYRDEQRKEQQELTNRMEEDYNARSATFVLSTSLAFEAFILFIATVIFTRRDY